MFCGPVPTWRPGARSSGPAALPGAQAWLLHIRFPPPHLPEVTPRGVNSGPGTHAGREAPCCLTSHPRPGGGLASPVVDALPGRRSTQPFVWASGCPGWARRSQHPRAPWGAAGPPLPKPHVPPPPQQPPFTRHPQVAPVSAALTPRNIARSTLKAVTHRVIAELRRAPPPSCGDPLCEPGRHFVSNPRRAGDITGRSGQPGPPRLSWEVWGGARTFWNVEGPAGKRQSRGPERRAKPRGVI